MMRNLILRLLPAFLVCITCVLKGQNFPQQAINDALKGKSAAASATPLQQPSPSVSGFNSGVRQLLSRTSELLRPVENISGYLNRTSSTDTIFVGGVPNDTLVITGTFFNNGPILVFNDGVLIFHNASATILGDVFIFQDGKMFADSSTLSFPQLYFYQRSWILANNGYASVNNCTLDFSGLSHNLLTVHNAQIEMHNIQNIGFTTASAYGSASISIDSTNQAGEFILTDSATYTFNNANTILLWHTVPENATMNVTFPPAGTVATYTCNPSTPGITGINYDVQVTNCTDVMWALMPVNGSDVTINGSTIRAIGLWFERGDTVNVSGLVNNSSYTNFTAPLSDRTMQLNNCSVQTWSLYTFDTSNITVSGCIVGEVGSMGRSLVTAQGVLCDGSGGYYWTNDTSLSIAISSTVFSTIRSQGNGIFLFGYGSVNGSAEAVGNAVLVVTQSSLPQEPIPYEKSVVWRIQLNSFPVSYVNNVVDINGSAWIDQGPLGSFMDYGSYDLFYSTSANPGNWIPISNGNTNEVRNAFLGQWNTTGLTPGSYNIRLNTFNNLGDSIDAVRQITLLPSIVGLNETPDEMLTVVSPNPANDFVDILFENKSDGPVNIYVADVNGKQVLSEMHNMRTGNQTLKISIAEFSEGTYFYTLKSNDAVHYGKFVVSK